MRHLILRLAAVLWLIAGPAAADGKPLVILVSMDGFRGDYLDRGITPNLSQLAADGARGAVRPSFPSKTYPNHYTLVTGLRPDRHGLVDNVMVDPLIPGVTFKLSDRATVKDPRWWNDATPLWVTAERQGVISASVFWPGSETAIQGAQPTYWLTYDYVANARRFDDPDYQNAAMARGAYQVLSMIAPWLEPEGRELFQRLSREYIRS